MEPLHIQPGNLNILVFSLEQGSLNLVAGKIYRALVQEQVGGDRLLLQIGSRQVVAENQAGLKVGQTLHLVVKEVNRGKVVLQALPLPGGDSGPKDAGTSPAEAGGRPVGLLERIFKGAVGDGEGSALGVEREGKPGSFGGEGPSYFYPLALNWQNLVLKGDLGLWKWDPEKPGPQEGSGAWRALLRLYSPGLGPIEGDILFFNRNLQIILKVEQETTRNLVLDHLAELAKALEQAGLQVNKLTCRSGSRKEEKSVKADPGVKGLDLRV